MMQLGTRFLRLFRDEFLNLELIPVVGENRFKSLNLSKTLQPDFIGMDKHSSLVVMDYKITEKPVCWQDVKVQLYDGAVLARELFAVDEDVILYVCNFIKSTEEIAFLREIATREELAAHLITRESTDEMFDSISL